MILNILILILILILIILFKSCKFKIEKFIILPKKKLPKKNTKSIKIPKKIWQTHETNDVPQSTYNNITKLIMNNPDFEYNFFDKNDRYQYIKNNFNSDVLKAYSKIDSCAGKSDIWRLAVLLKEGGIYFDCDFKLIDNFKTFTDIIDNDDELIHGRGWFKWEYNAPHPNGVLCSVPNHPVIKDTFDSVIDSILNNKPLKNIGKYKGWTDLECFTGTPHLWKAIIKYTGNINLNEGKYDYGINISNKIFKNIKHVYSTQLSELSTGGSHWMKQKIFNSNKENFENKSNRNLLTLTTISICIPCFPRDAAKLEKLINSINKQSVLPNTIIIAHSEMSEIDARKLEDKYLSNPIKVVVISTPKQQWAAGNRNMATSINTNDYITFIDADDTMFPNRIQILLDIINKYNPFSIIHNFTTDSNYKYNNKIKDIKLGKEVYDISKKDKTLHLSSIQVHHGHITIHKDVIKNIKQNITKKYRRGQDSKFVRDILEYYGRNDNTMVYIDIPLTYYIRAINQN